MIVTNAGKAGVNSSDQVKIDKVVFSDFRLSSISDYEQQQITAIQGTNTISANPTVALLSNGHALIQASVEANFNVNSAFILATGNNIEFLLAVTDSNGSLSEEINIDAIRRLSFNATANNLVMKSDVSSLVASAVSALPSASDDASSYADDAYNRANNYTNSYVDDKLNSNLNLDSTYANQAYSSATSYTDSRLATKVDTAELSNYANQSELSNYATNSALADYATSSNVDSVSSAINSQLANKADIGSLIPFATQSSVDAKMNTKADTTQLSNYVTAETANDQFSTINSTVANKANLTDLSSYATSAELTALSSQVINGLSSKADNVLLTSLATSLVNSANGSFNAVQQQASTHFQFHGVYKDGILSLANQDDGAYELYGNAIDGPPNFFGYGIALKYHNTWNTLIMLYDNATSIWTNRQGPGGWTGWRQIATTDMIDAITPDVSTVGKVEPSTIFKGYIDDTEFKLQDLTRPDGFYKVSMWGKQPKCDDLPDGFYPNLGYTIQKTTIDEKSGVIHVVGTKNQFTLSWVGLNTNWGGWVYSNVT